MPTLEDNLNNFDRAADKLTADIEKELIQAYSRTLKDIKAYLAEIYDKYGTADSLSFWEMQKYNRMLVLEDALKKRLQELTGKTAKTLEQTLKDIYELAYYGTGFSLDQQVFDDLGTNIGHVTVNEETVIQSIQNPISGLTLNERLEKNRINLVYSLKQELTQGLILGESYQKMAKRLQTLFEGYAAKSIRVAQTESHRVKNASRFDSMQFAKSKGINLKKRWISTLDTKTRRTHQHLDGKEVNLDKPFISNGFEAMYPGSFGVAKEDINCRCTYISVIDGYEPKVRASRGTDGKTKVIKYTTYDDWKKANIKG